MKIPMMERQIYRTETPGMRLSGAPAMDAGMDTARALQRLSATLGDTGYSIASAGLRYEREKQESADRLAAARDRNLLTAATREAEAWIDDNPAAQDEEKLAKVDEFMAKWKEGRQEFLSGMSPRFRQMHDEELESYRAEAEHRIRHAMRQGWHTAQMNRCDKLLRNAAESGNPEEYRRIIEEQRGKIFSDADADLRLADYGRLSENAAATRLAEADPDKAVSMLSARTEDGAYAHFAGMDESLRKNLLGHARTEQIRRSAALMDEAAASFLRGEPAWNGQPLDEKTLEQLHESGEISAANYKALTGWFKTLEREAGEKWLDAFAADMASGKTPYTAEELDSMRKTGEIDDENYRQAKSLLDSRTRSTQELNRLHEARKKETEKQLADEKKYHLQYNIETFSFSMDPRENAAQLEKAVEAIRKHFPEDFKRSSELIRAARSAAQDALSGSGVFQSPTGKVVLEKLKKTYMKKDGTYKGLIYDDGWFTNGEDSQQFQEEKYYQILNLSKEYIRKGKTAEETVKMIETQVEELNRGRIRDILQGVISPKMQK